MHLAAEGGYDAVQMRDIASESDVALGTIYRYFGSKDELLLAGFARWVTFTRRQLADHGPVGESPAERVANALTAAVTMSDNAQLLMSALITATSNTEAAVAPYKIDINEAFMGIISDAIGEDRLGIDVRGIERVLSHVWFSAITRWVGGLAPAGSVASELRHAVSMLLPDDALPVNMTVIDLQESGWVSNSMQADAGTGGLNK